MKQFIDEQVAECGFATVSEYVHMLVREDQKRKAEARLEALLLEGLDSGPPIEVTLEWWQHFRAELIDRQRKPKG